MNTECCCSSVDGFEWGKSWRGHDGESSRWWRYECDNKYTQAHK